MAYISFFMGCRIEGNKNSKMKKFLESFYQNSLNPDSFEVLVKFDDDDPNVSAFLKSIEKEKYFKNIKYIITPREQGYADLHKAYNSLLPTASPESLIYWVLSDDCEVLCKNWDKIILEKITKFPDGIFVMHPAPLVRCEKISGRDYLEKSDPYPIWGKDWIKTIGGFGFTLSSDGWSALLERELLIRHGLDRRIFLHNMDIKRYMTEQDFAGSERFLGVRKDAIDKMLSQEMTIILKEKVDSLYRVIKEKNLTSERQENYHKFKNKIWAKKYIKKINKKLRKLRRK
jgi:hypothetical protein